MTSVFDFRNFPADKLFEYQWPQIEKNAEWFFLQEHLSDFLGVNSFKRKYPGKFYTLQLKVQVQ